MKINEYQELAMRTLNPDLNKKDANINAQKYDDQLRGFLRDYKIDENELVEAAIDVDEILSMDFDDIANVVVNDDDIAQGKDVIGGFFNFQTLATDWPI